MSAWRLGWRMTRQDLRAGELTVLWLAVALAVAALSAVAFFADRLQGGLQRDARSLLGGDAVLRMDQAPGPDWVAAAQRLGLRHTLWLSFPTMARATDAQGAQTRLVALKAVDANYPLLGQLQTRSAANASVVEAKRGPEPGTVWVEAPVLDVLGIAVGDSLWLGDALLTVTRTIALESDRGGGFVSFSPRVMMNAADLARTDLIQPASRVTYRLAVAGAPSGVRTFQDAVKQAIQAQTLRGAQLESLEEGRPETTQTLDRARDFLNLVAMLTVVLAAVAVGNGARHFAQSRLDACALYRVLGVAQRTMARAFALELLWVGLMASALGLVLGLALHQVFVSLLAGLLQVRLPLPGLLPAAMGLGLGVVLIVSFGLPTVLQLAQVPPLRVMRRDLGGVRSASVAVLGLGVLSLVGLMVLAAGSWRLGLISAAGVLGAGLVFAGVAWAAVWALQRVVRPGRFNVAWVLATRTLAARPALAVVQVGSVAMGLMIIGKLLGLAKGEFNEADLIQVTDSEEDAKPHLEGAAK